MSILKFKLVEEHLKLLKHLKWDDIKSGVIKTKGETPFDGLDYYEDMGIILYGMPKGLNYDLGEVNLKVEEELHVEENTHPFEFSEVQKVEMDDLFNELPMALEIVLNTQSFIPGDYKCKFHIREWKLKK